MSNFICVAEWEDGGSTKRPMRGRVLSFVYGSKQDDIYAVLVDRDGRLHAKSIYNLRVLSDLEVVTGKKGTGNEPEQPTSE